MSFRRLFAISTLLFLAAACTAPKKITTTLDSDSLWAQYLSAVERTKIPEPADIYRGLVPLNHDNPGLIWNAEGKIRMVSWTKASYFANNKPGDIIPLYGDSWFTAVPYLQKFCSEQPGELQLRLAQRLGMPPDAANDTMVEFWINPADLFRPCPDPEISDSECLVRVPLVGQEPTPGPDNPPWYCGPDANQVSASFVVVGQQHLDWMCNNWISTYTNPDPKKRYPWTALGYTYDWGSPTGIGESEYVALKGTRVEIYSITPMDQYCSR